MPKLAKKPGPSKALKPSPDFPLFPHATGRWAKKVRGQLKYFGKVADDPKGEAALVKWLDEKDDLLAGRTPRATTGGVTLADLCNSFLTHKRHQVDTLEISQRHFTTLHDSCELLIKQFGRKRLVVDLTPDDFAAFKKSLAKTRGAWALGGVIQRIRSSFKYGYDCGLLDKPVRFGPAFTKPGKAALRREKADKPPKLFAAEQIRTILDAAEVDMRAMALLGINCGLGNADCGKLQFKHLDLENGWLNFPRPKTGVDRRCPLWKESTEALKAAIAARPADLTEETKNFVFLNRSAEPWEQDTMESPLSAAFRRLLDRLNIYREGLGFYAIRHTFATIAGATRDQVAVNHIMGHADGHISAHYREHIEDGRLIAVSNYVSDWLWAAKQDQSD